MFMQLGKYIRISDSGKSNLEDKQEKSAKPDF